MWITLEHAIAYFLLFCVWLVVGGAKESVGLFLPHIILFWFITTAALALGRYLADCSSGLSPPLFVFYALSASSYLVLVVKMASVGFG